MNKIPPGMLFFWDAIEWVVIAADDSRVCIAKIDGKGNIATASAVLLSVADFMEIAKGQGV